MFKKTNKSDDKIDRRLSIAPMMNWTDRHCRFFHRILSPKALLFTEMVPIDAIINSGAEKFCLQNTKISPVAIQLGGSDPEKLSTATKMIKPYHYDEINLNLGCPSPKVQSGNFGACLMKEPELVKECLLAIKQNSDVPVSIKCRIGIDDMDIEKDLDDFMYHISVAGIKIVYLHSRIALLKGLSPKQNREVPKLNYERSARLARDFKSIDFILNGGINSINKYNEIKEEFNNIFCGLMIGREAYRNPKFISEISREIFNSNVLEDKDILKKMLKYAKFEMKNGTNLNSITRHMIGMFHGFKGAKNIRKSLVESARSRIESFELFQLVVKEYCVIKS